VLLPPFWRIECADALRILDLDHHRRGKQRTNGGTQQGHLGFSGGIVALVGDIDLSASPRLERIQKYGL